MINEKIAIVGTPCQILAASKINYYEKETGGSPIDLKIGLFCMENFSYTYLKMFLKEKNMNLNDVKEFRIENNKFKVFLEDSVQEFSIPQTNSFKRKNCDICTDYTSNLADISVGSVGSPKGYSTVIIRNEKGDKIVQDLISNNLVSEIYAEENALDLLKKISNKKINNNLKNIKNRENNSHPVIYKRKVSDNEITELSNECQFDCLNSDVISEGACVLCGACEFVCPIDIIQINERKPVKKGTCKEGCHACYYACPRTFINDKILPKDLDIKPLGEYLKIYSLKSNNNTGQDGGIVSEILLYLLDKELADSVFIVGEDADNPWKPIPKLTSSKDEVLKAKGTKYSTVPIIFKSKLFRKQ
ncbi:MAG: Coenzyme F420 hydrogenase/dehydrogenase, beta subunit C-terminal domain [Methanobrevibacter sp.]|jgi:coenzyme F420 hydrogenase subunit beta|nr:Coenzyme F420 hydrogenase/dehydrogenase, beta subunit C-terminal domain [Candidatus Methanovirga basalitermitum]